MLIPMRVKTVTHTPGSPSAVAVLETLTDDRTLALTIPLDEAHRLARALGLGSCRCAPIYDLVDELLTALDTTITRAVLEAQENGIGAALTLGADTWTLSCHPADALALALRSQAPVYATTAALAHACPAGPHDHSPHTTQAPPGADAAARTAPNEDVSAWLRGLRPADFAEERPAGEAGPDAAPNATT